MYQVVLGATHSILLICTITFQGDTDPDGDLLAEVRNGGPDPSDRLQGARSQPLSVGPQTVTKTITYNPLC